APDAVAEAAVDDKEADDELEELDDPRGGESPMSRAPPGLDPPEAEAHAPQGVAEGWDVEAHGPEPWFGPHHPAHQAWEDEFLREEVDPLGEAEGADTEFEPGHPLWDELEQWEGRFLAEERPFEPDADNPLFEALEDIATLTGGTALTEELGVPLEKVGADFFGKAGRITISKDTTTIVRGGGKAKAIKERASQIQAQIESTSSDYDREKLEERLAKLTGGVALIKVGGHTEAEMKASKDRVEDALNATRAAIEEGVVPGGGVALLRAAEAVAEGRYSGEEKFGAMIIERALEDPLRWIAKNAGEDGAVVAENIRERSKTTGYNALTGEYVDMIKAGVIDPAKVVRSALQNAASIAGLLLTTDTMVTEIAGDTAIDGSVA
ncbi:MAG: TCP-1/cpn60 chaperonin family protein, partial [bacterium]